MSSVVRIRRKGGVVAVDCDVYIGRPWYQGGWRLPGSKWANPFKITPNLDRAQALVAYEAHLRASPALMAALPELRGQRLGCFCRPAACHGDVLVKLLREHDIALAVRAGPTVVAPTVAAPIVVTDDDPLWQELEQP